MIKIKFPPSRHILVWLIGEAKRQSHCHRVTWQCITRLGLKAGSLLIFTTDGNHSTGRKKETVEHSGTSCKWCFVFCSFSWGNLIIRDHEGHSHKQNKQNPQSAVMQLGQNFIKLLIGHYSCLCLIRKKKQKQINERLQQDWWRLYDCFLTATLTVSLIA